MSEQHEVKEDELIDISVRKQTEGFVKPKFTYFQMPKHLEPILHRLNLDFSQEDKEDHFKKCKGVAEEREWMVKNTPEYFSLEWKEFCDDLLEHDISFVPDARYKDWQRKMILSQFKNMPCPIELEMTCEVLDNLKKAYDINSPKIFLLVRELLTQYLIGIRIDKEIMYRGMFQTYTNAQGNQLILPHSGMKSKFDFAKLFLEYIQVLDEITRDVTKFSIQGEMSIPMLMKKIIDSDKVIDVTANQIEDKHEQS